MGWNNRWWWPGLSSICRSDETWSDCGYNLKVEPRKFANELDVGNERRWGVRVTTVFQAWVIKNGYVIY